MKSSKKSISKNKQTSPNNVKFTKRQVIQIGVLVFLLLVMPLSVALVQNAVDVRPKLASKSKSGVFNEVDKYGTILESNVRINSKEEEKFVIAQLQKRKDLIEKNMDKFSFEDFEDLSKRSLFDRLRKNSNFKNYIEEKKEIDGDLIIEIAESFEEDGLDNEELNYFVQDKYSQKVYELRGDESKFANINPHSEVKVMGYAFDLMKGNKLIFDKSSLQIKSKPNDFNIAGLNVNDMNIVNVYVDDPEYNGYLTNFQAITNRMTSDVKPFFESQSYGDVSFMVKPHINLNIPIDADCSESLDSIMRYKIVPEIDSQVNFEDGMTIQFFAPCYNPTNSGWAYFDPVTYPTDEGNKKLRVARVLPTSSIGNISAVIKHELGHTLGLWHSGGFVNCSDPLESTVDCGFTRYGDSYNIMGKAYHADSFSGTNKLQLDWLPFSAIKTVNSNISVDVYDIDKVSSNSRLLKVPIGEYPLVDFHSQNGGFYYHVEYDGEDNTLILRLTNDEMFMSAPGSSSFNSIYLGGISHVGDSFFDPVNNLNIKLTNLNNDFAKVSFDFNGNGGGGGEEDTEPPSISVIKPANNSTVSDELQIQYNVTDNVEVSHSIVNIWGLSYSRTFECNSTNCNIEWDTKDVRNADYIINIEAFDTAPTPNKSDEIINVTVSNITEYIPARMIDPIENSEISFPFNFQWSEAQGALGYYLFIGTGTTISTDKNLYSGGLGRSTDITLNSNDLYRSITNGQQIYVTLWTQFPNKWDKTVTSFIFEGGAVECEDYVYSNWNYYSCYPNGIKTRSVLEYVPNGCEVGAIEPLLQGSCNWYCRWYPHWEEC